MNTEFFSVALDRLRYSLVWEGCATLYAALDIEADDNVLVITGAGCNVFNALLREPRQVTAIDLNPEQNRLLEFKRHVVLHHPYPVFRGLLGLDGPAAVARAWAVVQPGLDPAVGPFWAAFFAKNPAGLLGAGRLEAYVHGFLPTLAPALQEQLRALFACRTVAGQQAYFATVLEAPGSPFRRQFSEYFDEANLSKGRDPRLFRYAAEGGGALFYRRLQAQVGRELLGDNFFSRFFFFGPENLPDAVLPPCYQAGSYEKLRRLLPRLRISTGEATAYLLSATGQAITKASLSNIFEYVSPKEFEQVCGDLGQSPPSPLRAVFWNLLQSQAPVRSGTVPLLTKLSEQLSQKEACFYFENVRVLTWGQPA